MPRLIVQALKEQFRYGARRRKGAFFEIDSVEEFSPLFMRPVKGFNEQQLKSLAKEREKQAKQFRGFPGLVPSAKVEKISKDPLKSRNISKGKPSIDPEEIDEIDAPPDLFTAASGD